MTDFKVGDKVKCITAVGSLTKNKIYDVVKIYDGNYDIMVVGDNDSDTFINGFMDRFELVEQEIDYLDILKGY